MLTEIPLAMQTLYAELLDRCQSGRFNADFPPGGSFVRKIVQGKKFWYYQETKKTTGEARRQRYAGPDSDRIRELIAEHGQDKRDNKERREIVQALKRTGLPAPSREFGEILQGLEQAGVFRMRACLIGTLAFQTYGPLLGVRLPGGALQTQDLDLAQFRSISLAIAESERIPSFLDLLRGLDASFAPVPGLEATAPPCSFANARRMRVDILVPNRSPEEEPDADLPALGCTGMPLRFLDFLVYEAVPAAVLHGPGVLVNVPCPERFAVHKLLLAERRGAADPKQRKDLAQAATLLDVLRSRDRRRLSEVLAEAKGRGPKWRRHIADALRKLPLGLHQDLAEGVD